MLGRVVVRACGAIVRCSSSGQGGNTRPASRWQLRSASAGITPVAIDNPALPACERLAPRESSSLAAILLTCSVTRTAYSSAILKREPTY
jgi:hypothetical protein